MAPHSSTLAWQIPWTEETGGLQFMGSRRVGRNWAISLSLSCIGEGNGNPLQCSCLENPRDRGTWWAAVYGVAWLKRLSSSSRGLYRDFPGGSDGIDPMVYFFHYSLYVCQNYYRTAFVVKALNTIKFYLNISSYCFHIKENGGYLQSSSNLPKPQNK